MSWIAAWDGQNFLQLLAMDEVAPEVFRTQCGDPNPHGRAFGGQILAQAVAAAARTAPEGRPLTMMQFQFLQGTLHDQAIDLQVTALQEGKRFSARHVRGAQQGGRLVLDAQTSFASAIDDAPSHEAPPTDDIEDPRALPLPDQLPKGWYEAILRSLGYALESKPVFDFRLEAPPDGVKLTLPQPRLRFWVRMKQTLPSEPNVHAAAFAYLSDWWLNFAAVGGHQDEALARGGLYVASLNHAIWLHRAVRADDWLHFDVLSPAAASGRGLSIARVHDRNRHLVASATQECLMAPLDR